MSETDDGTTDPTPDGTPTDPADLSEEGVGGTTDGTSSTFEPEEDPDATAGA